MNRTFIIIFLPLFLNILCLKAQDPEKDKEVVTFVYEASIPLKNIIFELNKKSDCFTTNSKTHHIIFAIERAETFDLLRISSGSALFIDNHNLGVEIDGYFEYNNSRIFITIDGDKNSKILDPFVNRTEEKIKIKLSRDLTDFCITDYKIINRKAQLIDSWNTKDFIMH